MCSQEVCPVLAGGIMGSQSFIACVCSVSLTCMLILENDLIQCCVIVF